MPATAPETQKKKFSTPSITNPIHWILDWDGTLTQHDTLTALVNTAATCNSTVPVQTQWAHLQAAYLSDYMHTLENLPLTPPTSIAQQTAHLAALQAVEQRSIDRVSASAIFKGITVADVERSAAQAIAQKAIKLRAGSIAFLAALHAQSKGSSSSSSSSSSILSVHWSATFIRASLRACDVDPHHAILHSIHANELEGFSPDGDGLSGTATGRICTPPSSSIISSADKLRRLQLLRAASCGSGSGSSRSASVVYVGDSETDFECLIVADVGICVRDEPLSGAQERLAKTLERVGVRCVHVCVMARGERGVAWAADFVEIAEWMRREGGG